MERSEHVAEEEAGQEEPVLLEPAEEAEDGAHLEERLEGLHPEAEVEEEEEVVEAAEREDPATRKSGFMI